MKKNRKAFYKAVSKDTGIDINDLEYRDGKNSDSKLRETYVHPLLIPHIASWANEEFAVKVSKIINKYFVSEEIKKKDKLLD